MINDRQRNEVVLRKSVKMPSGSVSYSEGSPPDRILRAGRKLFFELGFQSVSTEMIAKEAGVSKSSLYKYFPNMSGLLKAVTEAEAIHFQAAEPKDVATVDDLRGELIRFGADLMRFLNRAEIIRFTQLMHEEARGSPDVAHEFYSASYGQTLAHLQQLFQQGIDRGFLSSRLTAEDMASQIVGMWEGIPMIKVQMGVLKRPFSKPTEWSEKCADTLLLSLSS